MTQGTYENYRPTAHPRPENGAGLQEYDDGDHGRAPGSYRSADPACRGGGKYHPAAFIMVLCIAIWAMTGAGYFWPMWAFLGLIWPIAHQWGGRRRRHDHTWHEDRRGC